MLIYVSGKISAPTREEVLANIDAAAKVAGEWMKAGHSVICPHTNSGGIVDAGYEFTHAEWMKADLTMIARCDAMVMVDGWTGSKGAKEEYNYAHELGIPILPALPVLPLHITEQRCPIQCQAFAEHLGKMYRLHLRKNADYGPANILGAGFVGGVVRLWDKMARLMNLSGFKLNIVEPAEYTAPREAANESIDDTLLDLPNYGVILSLLRQSKWGK
jgi:hypothetical protein